MIRRVRRLRTVSDQRGFTLIELLVSLTVGTVIVGAAFGLLDSSVRAFSKSENRVDSTQRGRLALELLSQKLRSQVCGVGAGSTTTQPVMAADGTSVSFWIDTTPLRTSTSTDPNAGKRLVGFSYSSGKLYELAYENNDITVTPTQRQIVDSVAPTGSTLFRYYAYNATYDRTATSGANAQMLQELTTLPVPAASLPTIVLIKVSLTAYPRGSGTTDRNAAVFQTEFNSRVADPFKQTAPEC